MSTPHPPEAAPTTPHESPPPSSAGDGWALSALLAGWVFLWLAREPLIVDDAYISFRYARHLVEGQGLVFNSGEYVEGFTNLAWVLLVAATSWATAGLIPIPTAAVGIAFGLVGLTLVRAFQTLRRLGMGVPDACMGAALLLGSWEFVGATSNGLESALFAWVLTELLARVATSDDRGATLAASALFWVRPEGLGVSILFLLLIAWRRGSARAVLAPGACVAASLLVLTLFRVLYYGEVLPNSVVAKSLPLELIAARWKSSILYLAGFALFSPALCLGPLLVGAVLWRWRVRLPEPAIAVAALGLGAAALAVVVVIRNTGDWMPHHRLLVQYAPAAVLGLGVLAAVPAWQRRALLAMLAAAVVSSAATFRPRTAGTPLIATMPSGFPEAAYIDLARTLAPRLAPGDVVSGEAIGVLAWHLEGVTIHDPLGLTNHHLARFGRPDGWYGRMDLDYTLGVARPSIAVFHFPGHFRKASPASFEGYEAHLAPGRPEWGRRLIVLVRRDRRELLPVDAPGWEAFTFPDR